MAKTVKQVQKKEAEAPERIERMRATMVYSPRSTYWRGRTIYW